MSDYLENLVWKEKRRQEESLNLIASENYPSDRVRKMLASAFTAKYAEGYPYRRFYGGCEIVDELEDYTIRLAERAFNANYANVQPHSGAQANMAVYQAILEPGDTVLALSLDQGGHLTHGSPANASGKIYNFIHYGAEPYLDSSGTKRYKLNYEKIAEMAAKHKARLIVAGGSSTVAEIEWDKLAKIAQYEGIYLMADVAHTAGFIVARLLNNPMLWADVMTTTTQKTLRGPRGGLILTNDRDLAKRIDSAVFPGTQGGPHMNTIAAKAAMLEECLEEEFRKYMCDVMEATSEFADKLGLFIDEHDIYYGKRAMPHMLMVDTVNAYGITGAEAQERLKEYNIVVNKQLLPNDPNPPSVGSGIRIGLAPLITRHMRTPNLHRPWKYNQLDIERLVNYIHLILCGEAELVSSEKEYWIDWLNQTPIIFRK